MVKCLYCQREQRPASEEYGSSLVYTSSGKAVEIFKCKHCHRMIAYVYDDEMVREPTEIEKKMWLSEPDSLAEMMKKKAKEPNEKPKS